MKIWNYVNTIIKIFLTIFVIFIWLKATTDMSIQDVIGFMIHNFIGLAILWSSIAFIWNTFSFRVNNIGVMIGAKNGKYALTDDDLPKLCVFTKDSILINYSTNSWGLIELDNRFYTSKNLNVKYDINRNGVCVGVVEIRRIKNQIYLTTKI